MPVAADPSRAPTYADLPTLPESDDRHAWDVFGEHFERGALNWITPDVTATAARLIRRGLSVGLGLPTDSPVASLLPERSIPQHTRIVERGGHDDRLDGYFVQGTSHWDGLAHIRLGRWGYYGNLDESDLESGSLGIDRLAPSGIATRGVLVDIVRVRSRLGSNAPDWRTRSTISVSELEDALANESITLRPGDVLLLRTGWLERFLELSETESASWAGKLAPGPNGVACTGLDPAREMAAWLWDNRVSGVVSDNPAVEALPIVREEGFLHRRAMAALGIPFGEMWHFGPLADVCARLGQYEFFLASVPNLLPGGAGSPANAIALV
jgi:kynurenine formamidase